VVEGPGVIGMFPEIEINMQMPFIYESCCPVRQLGATMSGWFQFRYIEGPRTGETFRATIDTFTLNLEPGTELIDVPFFEEWMNIE